MGCVRVRSEVHRRHTINNKQRQSWIVVNVGDNDDDDCNDVLAMMLMMMMMIDVDGCRHGDCRR
jgi:hypothetical protein